MAENEVDWAAYSSKGEATPSRRAILALRRASLATVVPGALDPPKPRRLSFTAEEGHKREVDETVEEYYHRIEFLVPALTLVVWAAGTVALTYMTKWAMSEKTTTQAGAGFAFPTCYSLVTFAGTFAGCTLVLVLQKQTNTLGVAQFVQSWPGIVGVAVLNVLSIWASDASLMFIGVALNQILKATTPMPTMAFGYIIENKRFSWAMVAAVAGLVLGAGLAVPFSDPDVTAYGLAMAALSTLAAAAGVCIKAQLMSRSKDNGLTPLVLLWYTTGLAARSRVPVLLLLFVVTSERAQAAAYFRTRGAEAVGILATASALAFIVGLTGNTLTKVTSALTITIAGSAKQLALIVVSGGAARAKAPLPGVPQPATGAVFHLDPAATSWARSLVGSAPTLPLLAYRRVP